MPFTPLHAGPAFLVKIFAPRWVSLPVFGVANVLIDAEVLYHRFAGNSPDHRHLHSFVGATLAGLLTLALVKPVLRPAFRAWNSTVQPMKHSVLHMEEEAPWSTAVISAMGGAWSHVAADALSHADMAPFWPWSRRNPLARFTHADLHLAAASLCLIGGIVLVRAGRSRGRRPNFTRSRVDSGRGQNRTLTPLSPNPPKG